MLHYGSHGSLASSMVKPLIYYRKMGAGLGYAGNPQDLEIFEPSH